MTTSDFVVHCCWCALATMLLVPFAYAFVPDGRKLAKLAFVALASFVVGSSLPYAWSLPSLSSDGGIRCSSTRVIAGQALGHIDLLTNDAAPSTALSDGAVLAPSATLDVAGWAADAVRTAPPRKLCLIVDGKPSDAGAVTVGGDRLDVVAVYKNDALLHSAFTITVAARDLTSGKHDIDVAVVGLDGMGVLVGSKRLVVVR